LTKVAKVLSFKAYYHFDYLLSIIMIATYQPKKRQRARKTGFRIRMRNSPDVLKRRRAKGRWKLTAV
jgi:ribosomal protein L34